MTGSMYAAISGLKTHMSALAVIGNNISNVNTVGYKAARYTFNEALYTTSRSGSDGTNTAGGRNPAQNGFGASIGTIDIDMSTKNYSPTGWGLDTMIDGDGFFLVGDKIFGDDEATGSKITLAEMTKLKSMNLTRLGNFNIDPNGYLVDGNGSVVWGFLCTEAAEAYDLATGLPVYGDQVPAKPEPGEEVEREPNNTIWRLDEMTADQIKDLNSARKKHGLTELTNIEYTEKMTVDENDNPVPALDLNGNVIMVVKSASEPSQSLSSMRLPVLKTTTEMVEDDDGNYYIPPNAEVKKEIVWVDRDSLKDGAEVGTVESHPQRGQQLEEGEEPGYVEYTRVEADSVTIDEKTGALSIMTADGSFYVVGYLAIAKVTNPNGVTHVDGRYYQALDGTGAVRVTSIGGAVAGVPSSGDSGLITGGLESSGTDLAVEITNMIAVQRGYQANTRIVTVTDSMLEELVNMKR